MNDRYPHCISCIILLARDANSSVKSSQFSDGIELNRVAREIEIYCRSSRVFTSYIKLGGSSFFTKF